MVAIMISGNEHAVDRLKKVLEQEKFRVYVNDHKIRNLRRKLWEVKESNIIHISSIKPNGIEGILWDFLFIVLKAMRKPVVLRWIGTDVLELTKPQGIILSKLIGTHLAISPWMVNELKEKYISAEWLVIPPTLIGKVEPLPKEFAVMAYYGAVNRNKFYGSEIVDNLAKNMPNVRFFIVGEAKEKLSLSNVEYFGFVPQEKLSELYSKTTVLIRMTKHDGLALMVLEAMSRGRYVIFSHELSGCYYANTYDGCFKILNDLENMTEPNVNGANYVNFRFPRDIWIERHLKLYYGLISKK